MGLVAYRLKLPETALIHPTVHVSQLKAFVGVLLNESYIPSWLQDSHFEMVNVPLKIQARRMVKRRNTAAIQYLVQWEGFQEKQAA